jgi:hypothetical protein
MQNEADLLDTDLLPIRTAEGIPPAVCEAAPMAYAIVICFASCIGSSSSRAEHQQEVSSVSGEVILSPRGDATSICPVTEQLSLAPIFRYPHRHQFHLAMDFPLAGSATGLPCSAEMTRSVRSALYAGSGYAR